MPMWLRRNFLLPLLFIGVAVAISRCAPAAIQPTTQHANGLSCQSYSNEGQSGTKGTDCTFKCPDGRLLSLPSAVVSQSKEELNFLFCGAPMPTPTGGPIKLTGGPQSGIPTATLIPLLTTEVSSCDLKAGIINFRLALPTLQDLTHATINVEIQGQPSQCVIPAGYPGTLACKLPPNTTFPTGVVVQVNNVVVNTFPYSGIACQYQQALHQGQGSVLPTGQPSQQPSPQPTTQGPPPTQIPPSQPPPTQPLPTLPLPTQPLPTVQPPTQPPPTPGPTNQPAPTEQPPATKAPEPTAPAEGGLLPLLLALLP